MNSPLQIEALLDRLGHLHRSYQREFAYSQGLNLPQLEALLFLASCNKYSNTPLALSEYLGLTKGTVSQTIISLENKKLLQKKRDPVDRRVVHLHLTSKGQRLVNTCIDDSERAKALSKSNDIDSLESSLSELLKSMQHLNDHRTFGTCYTCKFFRRNALGQQHQCGLTLEPLHSRESLQICREHTEPSVN
jgi:MarR family transcriptional regulator, negative regulator of the multidrug operon emrRAB